LLSDVSGCDHFLLRHWHRIKEGLHWRFAETPPPLMWPLVIVQRGLRTPTGRLFASFCIVGIRGLGFGFASTRRSTRRIAPFSGAR
jgi:hypothetical protein